MAYSYIPGQQKCRLTGEYFLGCTISSDSGWILGSQCNSV